MAIIQTPCIRFCEPAYAHSPHIAELSNTLSSLCYIVVGWLQLRFRKGKHSARIGSNTVLVGVGSALFHATQRFDTELLDELPMLSLMCLMLYKTLDRIAFANRALVQCGYVAVLACVVCTTMRYVHTREYNYFLYSFGLPLMLVMVVDGLVRHWRTYYIALGLLVASQVAWQTEQWMVRNDVASVHCYWLHSVWHLCSALALYAWDEEDDDTAVRKREASNCRS